MKKNILLIISVLSIGSFLYSGTIQPSLSMRFNDVVNQQSENGGAIDPVLVLGFAMSLEEGIYAGGSAGAAIAGALKYAEKQNKNQGKKLRAFQSFRIFCGSGSVFIRKSVKTMQNELVDV